MPIGGFGLSNGSVTKELRPADRDTLSTLQLK